MLTFYQKILAHKIRFTVILLLVIGGSYYGYKKMFPTVTPTMYVVSAAQKGTIMTTVSGTGQISATNQVDVKSKASGDVISTLVTNGQAVKAGQALAYLDSSDAQKTVRDAQVNLDSAKLAMQKLVQPADTLTLLQAENAITTAQESKDKAAADLLTSYDDAYTQISNAFLSSPSIDADLHDNLLGFKIGSGEKSIGSNQDNEFALVNSVSTPDDIASMLSLRTKADSDYVLADDDFNKNFDNYKLTSRLSEQPVIDTLLNQTIDTIKAMSQSAKSEGNFYDEWINIHTKDSVPIFTEVTVIRTQLSSDITQLNSLLTSLSAIQDTIKNDNLTIADSDRSIAEKTQSLADLKAGALPIDIQSQQLSLQQKQNALLDAQQLLSNYTVRAPFDGVIATLSIQKGDNISSGTSVATEITTQQTVEISLNEVDVSKVKIGQKVNLTFDAIPDLNITGVVADIDAVGTVTQGVVTYNIKISLDTQDDRVKSGMSVAASVITDIKQNVVMVPNAAIKISGNNQYVEVPDETVADNQLDVNTGILLLKPVKNQNVQVGISDDSFTEIISGINENDKIISRTIAASTSKTPATTGTSLLQQVGGRAATGGGGGGGRNFGGATAGR